MSSFGSLSHSAHGALTKVQGSTRILEAEMRMDASRGVTIARKQENLDKLKLQAETAAGHFANAIAQDAANTKKFIDSIEETNNRIREEAEKAAEEEAAKEAAAETGAAETGQNAEESDDAAAGQIVDVVIPETVVSSDLAGGNTEDAPKEIVGNVVNVSA